MIKLACDGYCYEVTENLGADFFPPGLRAQSRCLRVQYKPVALKTCTSTGSGMRALRQFSKIDIISRKLLFLLDIVFGLS